MLKILLQCWMHFLTSTSNLARIYIPRAIPALMVMMRHAATAWLRFSTVFEYSYACIRPCSTGRKLRIWIKDYPYFESAAYFFTSRHQHAVFGQRLAGQQQDLGDSSRTVPGGEVVRGFVRVVPPSTSTVLVRDVPFVPSVRGGFGQ